MGAREAKVKWLADIPAYITSFTVIGIFNNHLSILI
jgi:hypothetical protein